MPSAAAPPRGAQTAPASPIVLSASELEIQEDGGSVTYTVALASEPTHEVRIAIAASGETGAVSLDKTSLDFTASNWETAQEVTVTGVNDDDDNTDDKRTAVLTHTSTSTDTAYNNKTASVEVTVLDDDDPLAVAPTNVQAVGYDSALVVTWEQQSKFGAELRYKKDSEDDSQWVMQAPTGSGVALSQLENGVLYDVEVRTRSGSNVSAWVAGTGTPQPYNFSLGSVDGLMLLRGQAMQAVTLPAASGARGTVTYSLEPSSWNGLSFTASTRRISGTPSSAGSQTFAYTAADSFDGAGTTSQTRYFKIEVTASGSLTFTPDDELTFDEAKNETGFHQVGLNVRPSSIDGVTVTVASGDDTVARLYTNDNPEPRQSLTLTFTQANWNDLQQVAVAPQDDDVENSGGQRSTTISHTPSGGGYSTDPVTVSVTVIDDDCAPSCGTPSDPAITALTAGDGSATVTWTDSGSVSTHTVQYRKTSETAFSDIANVTSPYTVTGLENGTEYTVRVKGDDGATGTSDPMTVTPAAPVDTSITVTPGDGQLSVAWEAFSGSLHPGLGYVVVWTDRLTLTRREVRHATSPHVIGGLVNARPYGVSVWARVNGKTVSTKTVTAVPVSGSAPAGLAAAPAGAGALSASWNIVANADSYSLQYREQQPGYWAGWTGSDVTTLTGISSTTRTISGLDDGTDYELRVGAVTNADTNWSDAITATPYQPPSNVVLTPEDGRMKVSWTRAPGRNLPHRLQYRDAAAASWTTVENVNLRWWLEGLANGTEYEVRVGATLDGVTHWSSIARTALVGAPGDVALQQNDAALSASWTAGFGAASHKLRWRSQGASEWTTIDPATSPQAIESLDNSLTYEVQAGAVAGSTTAWSETVKAQPAPRPTGLAAAATVCGFSLSWTNVAGADEYFVNYRTAASAPWQGEDLTANPWDLVELRSAQSYELRVGARFDDGNGPGETRWSDIVTATTNKIGQVLDLAVAPGNERLTVSWTERNFTAGLHKVKLKKGTEETVYHAVSSPYVISGLDNGTEYVVEVSPACDGSESYIGFPAVTPQGLEVVPGNQQLTASWAGAEPNLRYKKSSATSWTVVAATSPYTVTGLGNDLSYDLQVGTSGGTWSDTVTGTPFGPPANLTVTPDEPGQLRVEIDRNTQIDARVLEWRVKDSGSAWNRLRGVGYAENLENLQNGTEYEVRFGSVKAGLIQWAGPVSATPFGNPTGLEVLSGDGELEVRWTGGEGAASHKLRWRSQGASEWTEIDPATSPHTISSLTNGNKYEIEVAASHGTHVRWTSALDTAPSTTPLTTLVGIACGIDVSWRRVTGATEYRIRSRETGETGWLEQSASGSADASEITLPSYKSETGYDVQVGVASGGTYT